MTAPKPRRRTIRFAIVAVVCLLLGAVTTVGVAWGLNWPGRLQTLGGLTVPAALVDTGTTWCTFREASAVGGYWRIQTGSDSFRNTLRAGWPAPAMGSEYLSPMFGAKHEWPLFSWHSGVRAPSWWRAEWVYLPCRPLFPGFALDTALYAAAWYLLIFTPLPLIRAIRRRFRVSKGMCGACGYDLNASPGGPCPECGKDQRA